MAESNGVAAKDDDVFATPSTDLKGWYMVDALDGRRWIGKIAASHHEPGAHGRETRLPLLEDEIVLHPAFEVPPDRGLQLVLVPQESVGPRMEKTMTMQPQWLRFGGVDIDLLAGLPNNGFPPVRVRRCSMTHLADWRSDKFRGAVRRIVAKHAEASKAALPDSIRSQPREKVQ